MSKKGKNKTNKSNPIRKRYRKLSETFGKFTYKLYIIWVSVSFSMIILNILFSFNMSVPIELYYFMVYVIAIVTAILIVIGLINAIILDKAWNINNSKNTFSSWIGRFIFGGILLLNLRYYVIPMTLDAPRIITGRYKVISGTVKYVRASKPRGLRRWHEKIQFVDFIEEKSGKIIKITFHVSKVPIGYSVKKIYYLPYTKWGIYAD